MRDQEFLVELLEARKRNPRLRERPVLVVLEEAHRVLSEARPVSQPGTRSLLELAEGRSWGVGFLIVNQSSSLLSHYVVENTGTKLVHLLGAGEDVEVMRRVMSLSESERRLFSELQVGEAMLLALRPFTLSGERITSRLWRVRLPYFAGHGASRKRLKAGCDEVEVGGT